MALRGTYKIKTSVDKLNSFSDEKINEHIEKQLKFLLKQEEVEDIQFIKTPTETNVDYSVGIYNSFIYAKDRTKRFPQCYDYNLKKMSITLTPYKFKKRTIPKLKINLYFCRNETKTGNEKSIPSIYPNEKKWYLLGHEIVALNINNEPSVQNLFPGGRACMTGYFCFGTEDRKMYENSSQINIVNMVSIFKELFLSDCMSIPLKDWNTKIVDFVKGKKQSFKPIDNIIKFEMDKDNVKN